MVPSFETATEYSDLKHLKDRNEKRKRKNEKGKLKNEKWEMNFF